ncbi:MAG: hypothetical protein ACI8W8_001311 [Rhodothermales bacterium]
MALVLSVEVNDGLARFRYAIGSVNFNFLFAIDQDNIVLSSIAFGYAVSIFGTCYQVIVTRRFSAFLLISLFISSIGLIGYINELVRLVLWRHSVSLVMDATILVVFLDLWDYKRSKHGDSVAIVDTRCAALDTPNDK